MRLFVFPLPPQAYLQKRVLCTVTAPKNKLGRLPWDWRMRFERIARAFGPKMKNKRQSLSLKKMHSEKLRTRGTHEQAKQKLLCTTQRLSKRQRALLPWDRAEGFRPQTTRALKHRQIVSGPLFGHEMHSCLLAHVGTHFLRRGSFARSMTKRQRGLLPWDWRMHFERIARALDPRHPLWASLWT